MAHRDIKPENLLLDFNGSLKLADFGLCSVYKYKGKERELKGACGSLPYIAPEMNGQPYHGEPVDVWSTGVVLFALLVGNTPWDEPTRRSPEFMAYFRGQLYDPWTRIDPLPLCKSQKIFSYLLTPLLKLFSSLCSAATLMSALRLQKSSSILGTFARTESCLMAKRQMLQVLLRSSCKDLLCLVTLT